MKRKWSLSWPECAALVVLLSASVGASAPTPETGTTNVLTLDAAIRLALENNPALRAFGARVQAAAGRAYQAARWTNPELELNVEEWPLNKGRGFSDAQQTIGLAQTLPYPGKKSLDKRIGGLAVRVSEAELGLRRTEIVRDVKAQFFRVLAFERLVLVSGELVALAESSATTARKRVDAGDTAYQEQLRAEVQWERARAELRDVEKELTTARQGLVTLLGRPELRALRLSGRLAETPSAALMQMRTEEVVGRHPSTLAAQVAVARAELELRRVALEPYPDVRANVSGGRVGETEQSIVQLGFSLPLPILDTSKGRKREARANLTAAQAELESVRQQLEREWANAQERYRAAAEQVGRYQDQVLPKANEALRLVRIGFEQGKFNFTDLADTQRTTAEVRLAYQQKLLELNVAEAEMQALAHPQIPIQKEKTIYE